MIVAKLLALLLTIQLAWAMTSSKRRSLEDEEDDTPTFTTEYWDLEDYNGWNLPFAKTV